MEHAQERVARMVEELEHGRHRALKGDARSALLLVLCLPESPVTS